ncbi:hypothetical protein S245_032848 [Arachis hypogaea]
MYSSDSSRQPSLSPSLSRNLASFSKGVGELLAAHSPPFSLPLSFLPFNPKSDLLHSNLILAKLDRYRGYCYRNNNNNDDSHGHRHSSRPHSSFSDSPMTYHNPCLSPVHFCSGGRGFQRPPHRSPNRTVGFHPIGPGVGFGPMNGDGFEEFRQIMLLEWTDDLEAYILKGYGNSLNYRMGL